MAKTTTDAGVKSAESIAASVGAVLATESWEQLSKGPGVKISQQRGEILELQIGQVAGPLTVTNVDLQRVLKDGDKPVDLYDAKDATGKVWRLPLSILFTSKALKLHVQENSVIYIRRLEDEEKKSGKGKGNKMKNYDILLKS